MWLLLLLLLGLPMVPTAQAQPVCAADQFNGRANLHVTSAQCRRITGILRPGTGSTFEGLQLEQVHLDDSTGVTLRNNTITSRSDGRTVLITGQTRQLRLEGNTITTTTTRNEHAHTILIADAHGTDAILRGNRLSNTSPGGEDLLQMVRWSGTWLLTQNTFGVNHAEDHIDIKGSPPGTTARVIISDNVFEGDKLRGQGGCILLHGEREPGGKPFAYTAEVTGNTFQRCRKALYHRISRGQTDGDPEGRTLLMTDNTIVGGVVVLESENATLRGNIFRAGAQIQVGDNGYTPRKVTLTDNTFPGGAVPPTPRPRPPTPAPPPPAPPVSPPQAARCNLELGFEYPQPLVAQVQFDLHVSVTIQGRPTASEAVVIPMPLDACPLALTADGWQTVCTCLCLADGDYSLKVRARGMDWTSAYSHDLDLDFTPTTTCTEPIPIPMVPAPRPTPEPQPQPGVAAPVIGGVVIAGGAAASTGGSLSIPGLVNRQCVHWKIDGPCACGFPPQPCVKVSYWEPRWMIETVKRPGTSVIAGVGQILYAALKATGVPAVGGGGAGNAPGSGHTNLHYNEAHVYSFPQIFGGPCTACAPVNALPVLHYASEMDAVSWRTTTAPTLPLPALLPLGTWGPLFPRVGFGIHGSAPVASGLAATRALNIAFAPVTPPPLPEAHVVLVPTGGTSTCLQLASPRPTQCMPVGTNPALWEHGTGSPTGTHVWVAWAYKTCCVTPAMSTCGITLPPLGGHGANMCVIGPPTP